mgnify:CR=1 FL=1
MLKLDDHGAPLLSVFGGKITTYRRLAEHALQKLAPLVSGMGEAWTAGAALPGGDFPVAEVQDRIATLQADFPFLTAAWALRLFRAYGTETWEVLGDAKSAADLGQDFGATLTEAELRWMVAREYARTAQDVLWRRSKLGLGMDPAQVRAVEDWIRAQA